jgi:integrase
MNGKARAMGLGAYPRTSLARARDAALTAKAMTRTGVDPIAARGAERRVRSEQQAHAAGPATVPTFKKAAELYIADQAAGWRNFKHAAQWTSTLATYAFATLGPIAVDAVSTEDVLAVLRPIWTKKTETASRVRGRIEVILDAAKAHGWRTGENPARWRGHLSILLPAPSRVSKVEHHAALDWRRVPAFMPVLAERQGMDSLALRFAIFTAARSGEVRGARWGEIDEERRVWTVPTARMKGGREHRVPLSDPALAVLREVRAMLAADVEPGALVFPARGGSALSDMTLTALLRRLGWTDDAGKTITAHGFRSSFRDWAGEATAHPREVIEAALAHRLRDKAEAAYARGDLMAKRATLMNDWATFCMRAPASVVVMPEAAREAVEF